jgi:hypothetical protein
LASNYLLTFYKVIMANLTENKLNTVLKAADLATINSSITGISDILPAGSLTDAQRGSIKSMDVSNKIFVEDVITEMGISAKGIIPEFINSEFIQNDLALFQQLDGVESSLKNLLQKVSDLKRIAGDEAYSMALASYKVYDGANQAGIAGAKQSYNKLKVRFESQTTGAGRPETQNNI